MVSTFINGFASFTGFLALSPTSRLSYPVEDVTPPEKLQGRKRLKNGCASHRRTEFRMTACEDLTEGAGHVALPDAIARKYPNSPTEWGWQFVFPATGRYFDREAQIERRHHLQETVIQKAVRNAARRAGITKQPLATVCVTVSQHISGKAGTTFERYRSFWVIAMSPQRRFPRTSSTGIGWV